MIHSAQRILIVEDNKTDARLIRDLLERYGYETLQTGDGFEGMKLALECLPDPDPDGYPVARNIGTGRDPTPQR
jgi:CheY-like chemotaxis protein